METPPTTKLDRSFYRPSERAGYINITKETPDDIPGAEIWRYDFKRGTNVGAMLFGGKRQKPDQHYCYANAARREASIALWIKNQKSHARYTSERRAERNAGTALKVGDILYSSWGYEQTNINFYEVVARRAKTMVQVRPICSKTVRTETGADYVVAVPGLFRDYDVLLDNGKNEGGKAPTWKRGRKHSISLCSHANAYLWDGRERYETAAGWGH